jgi:hypothetical protein
VLKEKQARYINIHEPKKEEVAYVIIILYYIILYYNNPPARGFGKGLTTPHRNRMGLLETVMDLRVS